LVPTYPDPGALGQYPFFDSIACDAPGATPVENLVVLYPPTYNFSSMPMALSLQIQEFEAERQQITVLN
jgi:hypothetical protein